jgi:surface antigen
MGERAKCNWNSQVKIGDDNSKMKTINKNEEYHGISHYLVMFRDLSQTRTTNTVVFAAVKNTRSKSVENSSEVMSRRDGAWWSCTDYVFHV